MYTDNITLFAENEKELESLLEAVWIYSDDVGMEFGREKCAMLIMRSRKRQITEGLEMPNQEKSECYICQEKEEGVELPSLKIASIHRFDDSKTAKKKKQRLITVTRNNMNSTRINRAITWKQKWEEQLLYGYLKWQASEIFHEKTWTWLRKRNLMWESESLLIAAQK